jgi:hypothetical protein
LRVDHSILPPDRGGFGVLTGPYQALCKNEQGETITSFNSPMTVSVSLNEQQKADHEALVYLTHRDNEWREIATSPSDRPENFELGDNAPFVVLADVRTTPLWMVILRVLGIISLLIGGALVAVNFYFRYRQRQQAQGQYEDYYHKEHGY